MPLVVNGVCRFTFNGTYVDRPWANILDMQIDTTGTVLNRGEYIHDTAGNLINSWMEHIAPRVVEEVQFESVSWVDLDQLAGTTGERSSTSEWTLPQTGAQTDDGLPGNAAALIRKETVSARGQRHGRWYQVGVNESNQVQQSLTPNALDVWQETFDDFLDEVNDEPAPGMGDRTAVVVHTTGTNPQTGTYTPISRLVVDGRLATQRRRLRG